MTMDQVLELSAYWQDHPPVHLLVAAFMGVKPVERPADLMRMMGVDPETGGSMRV